MKGDIVIWTHYCEKCVFLLLKGQMNVSMTSLNCGNVQKPLYHAPNVQSSKLSLKVVADTFVQINTMRVDQFHQQVHMFIHHVSRIMIMWSWCMWVEYCLRKWWHNYSICVLERETKSCVSVYAKMPGVNIIFLQYIRSRHNLDTRFMLISGGEEATVCTPLRLYLHPISLSRSLFISPLTRLYSWGLIFISPLFFFIRCCFNCELCWESWTTDMALFF